MALIKKFKSGDKTEEPKKVHHSSISQPKRLSTFTNCEMITSFRDKLAQSHEKLNTSYSSVKQEMIMSHCLNVKIKKMYQKLHIMRII